LTRRWGNLANIMQAFANQLAQATASSQWAENALAISEEWRATEVLVHRETLRALKDAKQHTESKATTQRVAEETVRNLQGSLKSAKTNSFLQYGSLQVERRKTQRLRPRVNSQQRELTEI